MTTPEPVARLQKMDSPYAGPVLYSIVILDRARCHDDMPLYAAPPLVARPAGSDEQIDLRDWLQEREKNARRLAASKSGEDKAGWLEDADYFARAVLAAQAPQEPKPAIEPMTMLTEAEATDTWNGGHQYAHWIDRVNAVQRAFAVKNGAAVGDQ